MARENVAAVQVAGSNDSARFVNWPRQFLTLQAAVSAAGADLDRVFAIVLEKALALVPTANGASVELLSNRRLVCRAAFGLTPKEKGTFTPIRGGLAGFSSISAQKEPCSDREGNKDIIRSSIVVPIPFEGHHVGQLKLYALAANSFGNDDLLAAQLLVGPIAHGLALAAQARGERARAQADKRFKATFEQAAVGIAHVAPDGRFLMVNERFCEIAGWDRDSLIAGGFQQITHPDDIAVDMGKVRDLLEGRGTSYSMEKRYIRSDGNTVWINLTVSLVRSAGGQPDFFVSVIEDISARRAAESDAEYDALTGLLNRRGVRRQLHGLTERLGPRAGGLATAFVDLDGFKAVNDKFGHSEGDRCLIKIAAALRGLARKSDLIARYGGDEFVALFPAPSERAARKMLDRLRKEMSTVSDGEPWTVGASIGMVFVPAAAASDPESLIVAADRLMYQAKQSASDQPIVGGLSEVA